MAWPQTGQINKQYSEEKRPRTGFPGEVERPSPLRPEDLRRRSQKKMGCIQRCKQKGVVSRSADRSSSREKLALTKRGMQQTKGEKKNA